LQCSELAVEQHRRFHLLFVGFKAKQGVWQSPPQGVSTPGHGQGEGPNGYKWSQTTQKTLGGAGAKQVDKLAKRSPSGGELPHAARFEPTK